MPQERQKHRRAKAGAAADTASAARKPGQRDRLVGALIALASERGYPTVSVADISTRAGVSSATFYEQFADKEDCLLAAYRTAAEQVLGGMHGMGREGDWGEGARAVLRSLVSAVQQSPDAGRLLLVEALAGGARVRAERDRVLARFEGRAQALVDAAPHDGKGLDVPTSMLLGGVRSIVSENLRTHHEDTMGGVVDELLSWIQSYAVPGDEPIWSNGRGATLPARVARQWLAASAPPPPPARLPRGRHRLPAAQVRRSQRTRIIHGTAEVMVAKGYTAATVSDIVAAAGISRDVFYDHFSNKHEAYLAAEAYGTQNLLEACAAAYFTGKTWPERVWLALQALVLAVSGNPKLTHLRVVECYAAGPAAIEETEQLKRAAVIFLQEGFTVRPQASRLPRLVAHAITGAVFESFSGKAAQGELEELPRQLPLLTYIATAPFIGPRQAIAAVERLSAQAIAAAPR